MQHISYSQYNTYTECPRSWYLGKKTDASERQTWYLPVGTAVHKGIEAHLAGEPFDLDREFYSLIYKQRLIEPNLKLWLAGGSTSDPTTKGKALQLARDCLDAAHEYLENFTVWEVEYDASGRLPGLDIPVKAYVDTIGEHKKFGPTIVDWKTGASKPKTNFQLETYAALLEVGNKYDYSFSGHWAMLAPKASKARAIELDYVDPVEVGAKYQKVYEAMMRKKYQSNVRFGCKFCFHQDSCLAKAGPTEQAKFYDRSAEDGCPF
jgi:hypothetical protein